MPDSRGGFDEDGGLDFDAADTFAHVAALNRDLTSHELPRIFCALKGLMRFISSNSSSAVDFIWRGGAVRDKKEGGPEALARDLTCLAGLASTAVRAAE